MRYLPSMSRRNRIVVAIVVPTLTLLLLNSGVFQWSPLNCWHDEVDITTGRVRHTRYLVYLKVSERIEDTWVSQVTSQATSTPQWRRVNTFSPGIRYSPHYRFHGALCQIKMLKVADSVIPFEPEARQKVADSLLAQWQKTESYMDADEYIDKITDAAIRRYEAGATVFAATDIPDE